MITENNFEPIKENNKIIEEKEKYLLDEVAEYQKGLTEKKYKLEDYKKGKILILYKIRGLNLKKRKYYFKRII